MVLMKTFLQVFIGKASFILDQTWLTLKIYSQTHTLSSIRTYKTQHVPASRLSLPLKCWVCLAEAACLQNKLIFKIKITVMLTLVTPVMLLSH